MASVKLHPSEWQADWDKAACLHPSERPDGGNNPQEQFEKLAPEGTPG